MGPGGFSPPKSSSPYRPPPGPPPSQSRGSGYPGENWGPNNGTPYNPPRKLLVPWSLDYVVDNDLSQLDRLPIWGRNHSSISPPVSIFRLSFLEASLTIITNIGGPPGAHSDHIEAPNADSCILSSNAAFAAPVLRSSDGGNSRRRSVPT